MTHIFISYSRKDQLYARTLAEDIRKHGFDVWIDDRIKYGDRWWKAIVKAIESCGAFIIIMSPAAEESKWVESEILLAQREKKPIFPLLLEGQEFALLITVQFADVRKHELPPDKFYELLRYVLTPADQNGKYIAPQLPASEPTTEITKASAFPLRAKYIVPLLVAVIIVGIFGLWQVGRSNTNESTSDVTSTPELLHTQATNNFSSDIPSTRDPFRAVVEANNQWTMVSKKFDGVEMVLVPMGCFIMGSNLNHENEKPPHQQCFSQPFWIDLIEVSNEQFNSFSGMAANTSVWIAPQRPRERVTWFEARDFCLKRDSRLPTEAEWEYAARGPDNLIYPWGDIFIAENVIFVQNSNNMTANVGSRPDGASWVGALDMSGNVWEWTSSIPLNYPYNSMDGSESNDLMESQRILRGGAFPNDSDSLRTSYRYDVYSHDAIGRWGFRCARDF